MSVFAYRQLVPQVSHREKLIEGALQCLTSTGYAKTTARDIAAAAGASLASISYHFGSKDALLNEALLRASAQWIDRLSADALAMQDADLAARFATAYGAAMRAVTESPTHRTLFASFMEAAAHCSVSPPLRTQLADHYAAMRHITADVVRTSLTPAADNHGADPDVLAAFLIAVCDGFTIQALVDPESAPQPQRLIESLTAALAPPRKTPRPRRVRTDK